MENARQLSNFGQHFSRSRSLTFRCSFIIHFPQVPADYHGHERGENAEMRDQMQRPVSIPSPLLRSTPSFPPFARKNGITKFHFIRRDIVFLNRCVPRETTETATSLLRKLGLENFYKVRKISFSFAIDQLDSSFVSSPRSLFPSILPLPEGTEL